MYRIAQLCEVIRHNWDKFAETIKQAVIEYITWHIGQPKVYDDLTIVHDQINFAG